jgi:hypothetical protein
MIPENIKSEHIIKAIGEAERSEIPRDRSSERHEQLQCQCSVISNLIASSVLLNIVLIYYLWASSNRYCKNGFWEVYVDKYDDKLLTTT